MRKFLNFSTILFSYVLITLLVISCGSGGGASSNNAVNNDQSADTNDGAEGVDDGADGVDDGADGVDDGAEGVDDGAEGVDDGAEGVDDGAEGDTTDTTDEIGDDAHGGTTELPVGPKDKCLLSDRDDKHTLAGVMCYEGEVIATLKKSIGSDFIGYVSPSILISSIENKNGFPTRTWDVSQPRSIQLSYAEDYFVSASYTYGIPRPIDIQSLESAPGYQLQILTFNFVDIDEETMMTSLMNSFDIELIPKELNSGLNKSLASISAMLAIKTQEDFISMGNTVMPELTEVDYKLPFVLVNNIELIADPSDPAAKFEDAVIPVAKTSFHLFGNGKKITLKSEIDTTASNKPAAIIGVLHQPVRFSNLNVDIDAPISGSSIVSTIVGDDLHNQHLILQYVNININSNITVYKNSTLKTYSTGMVSGLSTAVSCLITDSVKVTTAAGAAIQVAVPNVEDDIYFDAYIGGLVARNDSCGGGNLSAFETTVVDVVLAVVPADPSMPTTTIDPQKVRVFMGGVVSQIKNTLLRDNLFKISFAVSSQLPSDFAVYSAGGVAESATNAVMLYNNVIYLDFLNNTKINVLGGIFSSLTLNNSDPNIKYINHKVKVDDNMVFIADEAATINSFFAGAIVVINKESEDIEIEAGLHIDHTFFSSPYDYNNELAASFSSLVHFANVDIDLSNIILDNKDPLVIFKYGNYVDSLRSKVATADFFDLADAKVTPTATMFPDTYYWVSVSDGYPQILESSLAVHYGITHLVPYWVNTNKLIQEGLAARAAKNQEAQ